MQRIGGSFLVLAGLIAVSATGAGGEKQGQPQKSGDGTWVAVTMEHSGTKVPADAVEKGAIKLILKGDNYTVTMNGTVVDKGTTKVDMQKKPPTVDIKSEEGQNKGKTILAIVEVNGDTMKACYDMEGKNRPTEFATKEGSGHVLIHYKREAKKKSE